MIRFVYSMLILLNILIDVCQDEYLYYYLKGLTFEDPKLVYVLRDILKAIVSGVVILVLNKLLFPFFLC